MYDTLEEIRGQKEAREAMEYHYNEMQNSNNSSVRKKCFLIMQKIYNKYASIRKIWGYIENAWNYTKRFVKKVIEIIEDTQPHDYFYIMFFRALKTEKWFYKIGSSIHPKKRLQEHLNYYSNFYGGIEGKILFTVDTGNIAASSLEDKVRSYFIRKYGEENYKPKDRFLCEIDLEDIKSKIPTCLNALRAAEIV